jgi:murein L,D-transpeptidase YcbB/YkuD
MAYTTYRGKRVSKEHHAVLSAYERKFGAVQLNQGARTIAEQWHFWRLYQAGGNLAAYPTPSAPHIKWRQAHHALDINAGNGHGQAQHVAAFYRSLGVTVAFNVRREPWHMDTLNKDALVRAARRVGGGSGLPVLKYKSKGPSVIKLKKLLYNKGVRNFSGQNSSNRYNMFYGKHTVQAVKRFQRRNELSPDGVVGPSTWRKLGR